LDEGGERELDLRVRPGPDETRPVSNDDRLNPIAQIQLGENVRDVCLDRRFGDEQSVGDLSIREAGCEASEDLESSLREFIHALGRGIGFRTRRS
jgi:hypothetical protein